MYMILYNDIFIDVHILYTVNIYIYIHWGSTLPSRLTWKQWKHIYENMDVSKAGDIHLIEISGRVVDGAVVAEIDMQGKTFSLISFLLKRGRYIYRPGETNGRSDATMQWTDPFEMLKFFGLWHHFEIDSQCGGAPWFVREFLLLSVSIAILAGKRTHPA